SHQRQADRERCDEADTGRESERGHVPHVRDPEGMSQALHHELLLELRHREDAGGPGTEGDEADVPEGENARVADEDVESNDDRDLDERVDEVGLEVARDLEAEESRRHY